MPDSVGRILRREIEERAGGKCEYCLTPKWIQLAGCEVDHIISRKHGGSPIHPISLLRARAAIARKAPTSVPLFPPPGNIVACSIPELIAGMIISRWRAHDLSRGRRFSSHLLAVKFEPILRYFLDRKRIDPSNIESDLTQPNKVLGGLLDLAETRRALPEGYIFEMRGMLNEKTGYDFRNRIAHGFASDGECYESGAAVNLWWLMLNILVNASALLGED